MLTQERIAAECPGVRFAKPADEAGLVEMIKVMHADPDWGLRDRDDGSYPFSGERARATVQRAILPNRNHPEAGSAWIGVVGEPEGLLGAAMVCVHQLSLSEGAYMAEQFNYVYPNYRNTSAPDALVQFAICMADAANLILIGATMTRVRTSKSRFYERRFGPPIAAVHRYIPQGS